MVSIERKRNEDMCMTEMHASCSVCGWRPTTWVCAVTDRAAETADLDSIEASQLARVNAVHTCVDKKGSR